ncbi:MAG: chemotaxis protein CheW [candidate division NC10 bacterium]|nr:chemotaxis protein CheW [candidate division NC10 bacterium]
MKAEESGTSSRELLVFSLEERLFAIELEKVIQIIGYVQPALPPRRPPYVEGIIEFRDHFIPLMSLRTWVGLEGTPPSSNSVILILALAGATIGLLVDSVVRVLSQAVEAVTEPPPKLQGVRAEFLRGVFKLNGKPLLWINDSSLVASPGKSAVDE